MQHGVEGAWRQSVRVAEVQTPVIPVVGELIRAHPGTISLGQGVVHYGPPPEVEGALRRFLAEPENHKYQHVQGIPPLLERIEAKLRRDNGIALDGSGRSVVVTAGGNMGFFNAVLAVADPGDEIVLLTPYYFNHEMAVRIADCRAVCVATDENHQPRPEAIAAAFTPRTRAVVTISPNNPTGAVYEEAALRRINALCREAGVYHIHDEAYEYFTYNGAEHFSPGSIADGADHTISLFSLSKSYGFASWRIGYMLLPDRLLPAVKKIQDTNLICPPVISQWAAAAALDVGADYCRARLPGIAEARRLLLEALEGVADIATAPPARGAFYCLLRVHTDLPAMTLVERLVREHQVAAIPGDTFGIESGCYLRVAFGALEAGAVAEAAGRLVRGLRAIVGGAKA